MFNVERLELARKRRQLTAREIAKLAEITDIYYSNIIKLVRTPSDELVARFSEILGFPLSFFYKPDFDTITPEAVSFRSLKSLTSKSRNAALSAGELAYEFMDYFKEKFELPKLELPDLSKHNTPQAAAIGLRNEWGLGDRPIGNLIALMEAKGIRVFSLCEDTRKLDAYSVWRDDEPYIFLNTQKTSERTRFDAAHELGHLVLHRHGDCTGKEVEAEADKFASEFLMPENDVRMEINYFYNIEQLIRKKSRWGVSLKALVYRIHKLGISTDWQYRNTMINISKTYKNSEVNEMPREYSSILQQLLRECWKDGITKEKIAHELHIPEFEIEDLIFGLASPHPQKNDNSSLETKSVLSVVK